MEILVAAYCISLRAEDYYPWFGSIGCRTASCVRNSSTSWALPPCLPPDARRFSPFL